VLQDVALAQHLQAAAPGLQGPAVAQGPSELETASGDPREAGVIFSQSQGAGCQHLQKHLRPRETFAEALEYGTDLLLGKIHEESLGDDQDRQASRLQGIERAGLRHRTGDAAISPGLPEKKSPQGDDVRQVDFDPVDAPVVET